ncbi:transcription termination factor 2 [Ditylenchus destructor]|nr:transcription termination factor 2 [Ditylenchus destructor]
MVTMSDYRGAYISSDSSASEAASDSESDFWNESVKMPSKNLVKDYLSESAEDAEASDRDYSGEIIDNTLEQDYDQALDIGSGDAKESSPSSVGSKEKESFLESSGASSVADKSANSSGSILKDSLQEQSSDVVNDTFDDNASFVNDSEENVDPKHKRVAPVRKISSISSIDKAEPSSSLDDILSNGSVVKADTKSGEAIRARSGRSLSINEIDDLLNESITDTKPLKESTPIVRKSNQWLQLNKKETVDGVKSSMSPNDTKPEPVKKDPPTVPPASFNPEMYNRLVTDRPKGPEIIPAPAINPEMYNRLVSGDQEKRLFGGKMTDERFGKIKAITGEAPENVATEAPDGLKIELMLHQKHGLSWMLWRENQLPPGGILADDMGLGKTLSMISLILYKKNARKAMDQEQLDREATMRQKVLQTNRLVSTNATLVITPASLMYQWEKEIQDRVKPGRLKVHIFHGPKNKRETIARRLALYDVVITTYQLVSSELSEKIVTQNNEDDSASFDSSVNSPFQKKCRGDGKKTNSSVLTQIAWDRIILDEAHQIKNRRALVSKACCRIPGVYRWCLTETSADRLNALVKGLLLRRTKNQICSVTNKPMISLKSHNFELVTLTLQEPENRCYAQMAAASRQEVRDILNNKEYETGMRNRSTLLALLLRLRQACTHMALTKNAIDIDAFKEDGADGDLNDLNKSLAHMTLDNSQLEVEDENGQKTNVEHIFETSYASTKVVAILERLDKVLEAGDKCVIVSQWTSMLQIIEYHIKKKRVAYTSITGKILTKDRQPRVDSFNMPRGGAQVMLLSLTAGGVGLNLVGGNHLFMVDLHWNPALEQQACDRIYRMGQQKDVFIHNAASKNLKKLTMNDLKFLFELDRRPAQVPTSSQMIKPVSSIAPSGSTNAGVVNNGQPNIVPASTLPIPAQYVFHP